MRSVKIKLRDPSVSISDYYSFYATFDAYKSTNTHTIHDSILILVREELNNE